MVQPGQLLTLRRRSGLQARGRLRQLLQGRPRASGICMGCLISVGLEKCGYPCQMRDMVGSLLSM